MKKVAVCVALVSLLSACATGEQYQANVYKAGQTNQAQSVRPVTILGVQAAKIEVDNTKAKQAAMIGGALLGAVAGGVIGNTTTHSSRTGTAVGTVAGGATGAAAGSLVNDTTLVDGVSITFKDGTNMMSSAQVGKLCEFQAGDAIMISTKNNETRIQPNNPSGCMEEKKG
jgi:outer membrane lipoprotein SlyB